MRVMSVRSALLLSISIALIGGVFFLHGLQALFLIGGISAFALWTLEGLLCSRLLQAAVEERQLENWPYLLAWVPCVIWLIGQGVSFGWTKAVMQLVADNPRGLWWLLAGVQVLALPFLAGLLFLELRIIWLLGRWLLKPEVGSLLKEVLLQRWRQWRAASDLRSLGLWLLSAALAVGAFLWQRQELFWRLSQSALLLGLFAVGLRLLIWLVRHALQPLGRFRLSLLLIGGSLAVVVALLLVQVWSSQFHPVMQLPVWASAWRLAATLLLLRAAFWLAGC
ncbi:hypothetical protein [Thermogemmatispora tikiterensis]|uniref:Uncharacterized protein n=1 Tax=Thermogemmatispora tikiterensis TaxID=1825093 RepID=A0A328V8V2_9CHLR|nr:hypothetical protein [Thermogemmatispora tikiterensis]RAQ94047.1 hypothetical protein A4R35_00785 [Thermogemmatispora tikiterensis]